MPLLDLRTDLKSLRYGSDLPGGGDSGQPFIQNDINNPKITVGNIDDGFIRGGFTGAFKSSVTDFKRISKFFTNKPQGPLFIARQIGLQLSNPRLERRKGPFASAFGGLLEPTRIYNLGLNTLAQVPVNAFGTHFKRHGLQPLLDEKTMYESVVRDNAGLNNNNVASALKENRLLVLADKLDPRKSVVFTPPKPSTSLRERRRQNPRQPQQVNENYQSVQNQLGLPEVYKEQKPVFIIDRYVGGPGSVYGIGETIIRRYNTTNDTEKIKASYLSSYFNAGKTRDDKGAAQTVKIKNTKDFAISNLPLIVSQSYTEYSSSFLNIIASDADRGGSNKIRHKGEQKFYPFSTLGVSNFYFSGSIDFSGDVGISSSSRSYPDLGGNAFNQTYTTLTNAGSNIVGANIGFASNISSIGTAKAYSIYKNIIDTKQLRGFVELVSGSTDTFFNETGIYGDEYVRGAFKNTANQNILPVSNHVPIYQNGFGERVNFKGFTWRTITRDARIGSGRQDVLNLTPIFRANRYFGNDVVTIGGVTYNVRDLVKFKIQGVSTDNPGESDHIVFRAYLTSLTDDATGEWNDVKYAGRGDKFFIYNGFTRKINVSFKVAALSAAEMRIIYLKLNGLMGQVMPDYRGTLMRGPLTRLTIGNWVDAQLGKIDNVSFKVPEDSPWEIALDEPENGIKELILPHVVEVTLSFTPIGAETKASNRIARRDYYETSHIAQNNTGADVAWLQYISQRTPRESRQAIQAAINAANAAAFGGL